MINQENRKKIKVLYSYSRESDVNYRFEKLKSQGFKFILGIPWESRENAKDNQHIKFYKK